MTGDFLTSLNNNCSLIHLLFFPYTYTHKPTHLYRNKIVGDKFTFPIFRIRMLQVIPALESKVVNPKNDAFCFIAQYWWRLIFFFTLSRKYVFNFSYRIMLCDRYYLVCFRENVEEFHCCLSNSYFQFLTRDSCKPNNLFTIKINGGKHIPNSLCL